MAEIAGAEQGSDAFIEWSSVVREDLDRIEWQLNEEPLTNPVALRKLKERCQSTFSIIQRTAELTGVEIKRNKYRDLGFTDRFLQNRYANTK